MLQKVITTATWKQSQITILGTLINGGLGLIFYILIARFLGPSDFGLLVVSIVFLTLLADVVEFGTNTGLVRYVSANVNKEKALKFLKLGLEFKIIIWIIVLSIGFLSAPLIASSIFQKNELIAPLQLVMFGVGGALLLSYATSSLQAFQKYFIWSLVNICTNLFRLLIIILLFSMGQLNLYSGLLTFIILPFFGFSLALLFLPINQILRVKNELRVAKEFFKYNMGVGVFTIIAAISARLDTFLSARLLSSSDLGIYAAANQLVQVIPQLVGALGIVAAPKLASFTNNKDMIVYLKKFQLFVFGISLLAMIAIPLSFYFIHFLYGKEYLPAITAFIILFIAMLIFLISVPIHNSILFYFGKPSVFVWISIGHLIITGVVGYLLISNYGVIGAATTVLIGMIFNLIAPLCWFLIKIK